MNGIFKTITDFIKNKQLTPKLERTTRAQHSNSTSDPEMESQSPKIKGKRVSPQYKCREQIVNALNNKKGKTTTKSRSTVKIQEKFQKGQ